MLASAVSAQGNDRSAVLRDQASKLETAEVCGECHVSEYEVWKRTTHATGFKTLHRKAAAEGIAKRLGLPLIKRDSRCLSCHYTPEERGDSLRAQAGVSCESCHGAARGWIDLHNDYGGKGIDHRTETPDHRRQRLEQSRAAGMRRPTDLYDNAASCFGCHTVPDERLVNVGGHGTGSGGFELVAWAEGEIRHNFLASFLDGDGTDNAERPMTRKRLMYVVGRTLDLEYALRGVAAASEKGVYLQAMSRRVRQAVGEVREIRRRTPDPQLDAILDTVKGVDVGLGQRAAIESAATMIAAATKRFISAHDGEQLAGLDPLVLGTAESDDVEIAEVDDVEGLDDTQVADGEDGTTATDSPAEGAPGDTATTPTRVVNDAIPAVGEKKNRIRPPDPQKTVGPGQCIGCHRHQEQNAWWLDDAHYYAADRFLEASPEALRIASFYKLSRAQMTRGNQVCMNCHGTVIGGRESREAQDGVGCESCHGGAAAYLEPHQEGDAALGTNRPGYQQALRLGMTELKSLSVRAETCTSCHYVTDQRLLSSGHPSGEDFDYAEGMKQIRHWQAPPVGDAAVRQAFGPVLAARGPVPRVQLARAATRGPAVAQRAVDGAPSLARADRTADRTRSARSASRRVRPSRGAAGTGAATRRTAPSTLGLPELPPLPSTKDASVETLLQLIAERLDLLYRAAGGTLENDNDPGAP